MFNKKFRDLAIVKKRKNWEKRLKMISKPSTMLIMKERTRLLIYYLRELWMSTWTYQMSSKDHLPRNKLFVYILVIFDMKLYGAWRDIIVVWYNLFLTSRNQTKLSNVLWIFSKVCILLLKNDSISSFWLHYVVW